MLNGVRGRPPPRGGVVGSGATAGGSGDRIARRTIRRWCRRRMRRSWCGTRSRLRSGRRGGSDGGVSEEGATAGETGLAGLQAIDARDRTRRPGRVRSPRRSRDADRVARRANTHRARPPPRRTAPRSPAGRWLAYSPHRPDARARRCGRAREKTAKRAGVETRRAVRRRRSRSLRAGFPCASRGVDERSRACGPSRTYARGCDRRGGGGCQRNESRADVSVGFLVFFFLKSFSWDRVRFSLTFRAASRNDSTGVREKGKTIPKGGRPLVSLAKHASARMSSRRNPRALGILGLTPRRPHARSRPFRPVRSVRACRASAPRPPAFSRAFPHARRLAFARIAPGVVGPSPLARPIGIRPRRPHPRPSIDPRLGLDARLGLDTPLGSTRTISARR